MAGQPAWLRKRLDEQFDKKWESFSWLTLRAIGSSVNHVLGALAPRVINDQRVAWADGTAGDKIVPLDASSFILLGDPGEQDASQYVVAPAIDAQSNQVGFMIVMSDVIYPAGDVNDYVDGLYVPYRRFKPPILALPGNHDWYDGLFGFMWNFCNRESVPRLNADRYTVNERVVAGRLRAKAAKPNAKVQQCRAQRDRVHLPGPYYAIDLPNLRLVCVDTGLAGKIDKEQATWLIRVSKTPKDKVLLIGKPLIVNRRYHPCDIVHGPVEGDDGKRFHTVDDVVRDPDHRYVAAIGGDVHNYQRYCVHHACSDLTMPYIVSGGGGAYTSATHIIPATGGLEAKGDHAHDAAYTSIVEDPVYYPDRPQSLVDFSKQLVPGTWRVLLAVTLTIAGLIAAYLAARVIKLDDGTLEAAAIVSGLVVLLWLVGSFAMPGRYRRKAKWYPGVTAATGFAAGAAAGLAGWWLAPGQFETNARAAAVLTVAGAFVAMMLRTTAWWRPSQTRGFGIGTVLSLVAWAAAGFAGAAVLRGEGEDGLATAVGLIAAVGFFGGVLRETRFWSEPRAALAALGAQFAAALLIVWQWPVQDAGVEPQLAAVVWTLTVFAMTIVLLFAVGRFARPFVFGLIAELLIVAGAVWAISAILEGPAEHHAAAVAFGTLIALPLIALLTDFARTSIPGRYRYKWVVGVLVVLLPASAFALGPDWIRHGAAAATALLILTVTVSAAAHLTFLGAFSLLWRRKARKGSLSYEQAEAAIAWRDGGGRPDSKTRSIANISHPGAKRPQGPLHKFVAEIFDSDDPPFRKNFLKLTISNGKLNIECHEVTGLDENVPSTVGDTVSIDLDRRPAGEPAPS